jgi:hypothetical protein
MEFFIQFKDGKPPVWQTWSRDLFNSIPYEEYCLSHPPLWQLIYSVEEAKKLADQHNSKPITEVSPGDLVYLDLRWFGAEWYRQSELPNKDFTTYVVKLKYEAFLNKHKKKIKGRIEVFNEVFTFNHVFVKE